MPNRPKEMDTQTMNSPSRQQGQRFRRIIVLAGPGAGTVQPIPPSAVHPFDHLFDHYPFDDYPFDDDDDDYPAAPAHHGGSKRSRVAATSEAILSLQEVTGRSRSGEECAVCLQDFCADETLRAMPCSHAIHQHCISEWLLRNAVCPLCRRRLPEEEDKQRRRISE